MKSYRTFSLLFLSFALGGSSLIMGFNAAIDPFAIMNVPKLKGINQSKPETVNNSRLYKAIESSRHDIKTLFLGASRVEEALDPNSLELSNHQPAYNLAMQGATYYEVRRYLEHAIATQKQLKTILLGIDLWLLAYPEPTRPGFSEHRIKKRHLSLLEGLELNLSWDTFQKSLDTLQQNQEEPETIYYHPNGLRDVGYIDLDFTHWLRFVVNKKKNEIVPETLENIRIIRDLCAEHNIELKAFITPPHALQFEGTIMAAGEELIEQRKREVINILPAIDFSGYNSITTEPIGDRMTYYRDSSHFTVPVGDLILNRVLEYNEDRVPDDFGVFVTPENIDDHLAKIRQDRARWIAENPDAIATLQSFRKKR